LAFARAGAKVAITNRSVSEGEATACSWLTTPKRTWLCMKHEILRGPAGGPIAVTV
jgi:hypothetical protein